MLKTILAVSFGLAFVVLGIVTGLLLIRRVRSCEQCVGEVITMDYMRDSDVGNYAMRQIVRYTANGQVFESPLNFSRSNTKVGDKMHLWYETEHPEIVHSTTARWLAPLITGSLALLMLLLRVIIYIIF